jgi:hypothetical protein
MVYTILSSNGSQKKIGHELIYFSFPAVTLKLQSLDLQFSNFKALVISTSLVIGLEVSIILVKTTMLSKLFDVVGLTPSSLVPQTFQLIRKD